MSPLTSAGTSPNPTAVDVVLPCLDEVEAIATVLAGMPSGYRPIVVDNGSTDATALVAAEMGAEVVREPKRGFGAACWAGLGAATAPVVCFMDADASFDPRQLPRVADPVIAGSADLVLGARSADRGAWPAHARLANRFIAAELRRRTGVELSDLGPMRAARTDQLRALGLRDRRSGWPLEMVLAASRAGWRITEVVVDYRPRVGTSKVTGTIRGTVGAIGDMGRLLMPDQPAAHRGPADGSSPSE
ncbi:MAG: glycosyltransferase family 2 protein [Microthrixaceae bacterium]